MIKKIILSLVVLFFHFTIPATAQTDFSTWEKRDLINPVGTELLSPIGGPLIRMHSYTIAELEKQARQKLPSTGKGKREKIEYALSVLSLSMLWDEAFNGEVLSGLVQASNGTYSFQAQLTSDQKKLTLALVATTEDGQVLQGAATDTRREDTATTASYLRKNTSNATPDAPARSSSTDSKSASQAQKYAPPETVAQMDKWASTGDLVKALAPNDPLSPRYYLAQTGPKYGVFDFETAIAKLPSVSNLKLQGQPVIEQLEAWRTYDGSHAAIVMQETKIENADGVIVLFMTKKKGQSDFIYFGYEVTQNTFLKWGGITRMMKLRRVIPSIEAFPKSTRNRIARAPFKQQTELYEAGLNKVLENGVANMYSMSQTQTLMRMQELNYDLLLGGDITSPMIAD